MFLLVNFFKKSYFLKNRLEKYNTSCHKEVWIGLGHEEFCWILKICIFVVINPK